MFEVIRSIANRNPNGKDRTTLSRMAAAFSAGMIITAVLACIPVISNILTEDSVQNSAVPTPSSAGEFLTPGGSPDGDYHTEPNNGAPVYAPYKEGIFSV